MCVGTLEGGVEVSWKSSMSPFLICMSAITHIGAQVASLHFTVHGARIVDRCVFSGDNTDAEHGPQLL